MSTLVGEFWIGDCPECPNRPDMRVNLADLWECPECGLQIQTAGQVVILPNKGEGRFKSPPIFAIDYLRSNQDTTIREDYRAQPV